jgi:hypothetical protein
MPSITGDSCSRGSAREAARLPHPDLPTGQDPVRCTVRRWQSKKCLVRPDATDAGVSRVKPATGHLSFDCLAGAEGDSLALWQALIQAPGMFHQFLRAAYAVGIQSIPSRRPGAVIHNVVAPRCGWQRRSGVDCLYRMAEYGEYPRKPDAIVSSIDLELAHDPRPGGPVERLDRPERIPATSAAHRPG